MDERRLTVFNNKTGEIEEDVTFEGGYNVTYQNNRNEGAIYRIRKLNNAHYGEKHWIMNYRYAPIAVALINKFPEFQHIADEEYKILFIEDLRYSDPGNGKHQWQARIKKCSTDYLGATGYNYIIETRRYFTKHMTKEQITALIYHELRHIAFDGTLQHHDIEDWSNLVATLGKNWSAINAEIPDILSDDFEEDAWANVMPTVRQINLFEESTR